MISVSSNQDCKPGLLPEVSVGIPCKAAVGHPAAPAPLPSTREAKSEVEHVKTFMNTPWFKCFHMIIMLSPLVYFVANWGGEVPKSPSFSVKSVSVSLDDNTDDLSPATWNILFSVRNPNHDHYFHYSGIEVYLQETSSADDQQYSSSTTVTLACTQATRDRFFMPATIKTASWPNVSAIGRSPMLITITFQAILSTNGYEKPSKVGYSKCTDMKVELQRIDNATRGTFLGGPVWCH